jgi:hypothetical protein
MASGFAGGHLTSLWYPQHLDAALLSMLDIETGAGRDAESAGSHFFPALRMIQCRISIHTSTFGMAINIYNTL